MPGDPMPTLTGENRMPRAFCLSYEHHRIVRAATLGRDDVRTEARE